MEKLEKRDSEEKRKKTVWKSRELDAIEEKEERKKKRPMFKRLGRGFY